MRGEMRKSAKRLFLLALLLVTVFFGAVNLAPHIYTPPALPTDKLRVYTAVSSFIMKHRELGDLRLHWFRGLDIFVNNKWVDYQLYLSDEDIREVGNLRQGVENSHTNLVQSEGDMILFYPRYSYIMPSPDGVLFSMKGEDPNIVGGSTVIALRPFKFIKGKWYSSEKMKAPRYSGW